MKEILKKVDTFMLKNGGYALLIATIATVAFFAVLQWANDYVKDRTKPLQIKIDDEGYLYVDYQYDDKEDVFIFWETDAGNIKAENKTDIFKEQSEQEEKSKGYYSYSLSNERAKWSMEDADGRNYSTATVRAVLYEVDRRNIYKLEDYVMEITITLEVKDNKIIKAEDRVFSNPVREEDGTNWSQIYCIGETEDHYIYRYRTGEKINAEDTLILCWMSDKDILSEVDYTKGFLPQSYMVKNNSDKSILKSPTVIACKKQNSTEGLYAGLVDEDGFKKEKINKSDMKYRAELEDNKFLEDVE